MVAISIPIFVGVVFFEGRNEFSTGNVNSENNINNNLFLNDSDSATNNKIKKNWNVADQNYNASAVVALSLRNGQILYSNNFRQVRPIASITKLMVASIMVDSFSAYEKFVITQRAIETEGKKSGLEVGTEITIEEALYAILLESMNDVVIAFEDHYNSGFSESLVDRMNKVAESLGLFNTSFEEPTGISAGNVSNTYDVAQLLKNVFNHPYLKSIMSTSIYSTGKYTWYNTNTLLDNEDNPDNTREKGIIAGKTGYTEEAGQSISLLGLTQSGHEVLMVVLDAKTDRIIEGQKLWRWIQRAYIW